MNEQLDGIGKRLVALRAKLAARTGKSEYKENCKAIEAEIARLEAITLKPAVASEEDSEPDQNRKNEND